jgi:hypothetical protein
VGTHDCPEVVEAAGVRVVVVVVGVVVVVVVLGVEVVAVVDAEPSSPEEVVEVVDDVGVDVEVVDGSAVDVVVEVVPLCPDAPATVMPMPAAATVAVTPRATVARRMRTRAASRDRAAPWGERLSGVGAMASPFVVGRPRSGIWVPFHRAGHNARLIPAGSHL